VKLIRHNNVLLVVGGPQNKVFLSVVMVFNSVVLDDPRKKNCPFL
jgi:hypothetical protein